MNRLEGGCSVPLGVSSSLDEAGVLTLKGGVFSFEGDECLIEEHKVTLKTGSQR